MCIRDRFQTARRFNMEVQPQLVLLQKTLLNIEGLGRQLDPDLDLWVTARPILERWMHEQIGLSGLLERTRYEAPRWAQMVPQLPRLLHAALSAQAKPGEDEARRAVFDELLAENRRTRRHLRLVSLLLIVLAILQLLPWIESVLGR